MYVVRAMIEVKVLHVGDASGVAHVLAKFQNKLPEYKADVILRALGEPYGINAYYGVEEWRRFPMHRSPLWRRGKHSYTIAVRYADIVNRVAKAYDVVHIHGSIEFVSIVRAKYPNKKIILHHHGDNLRHMDPAHREKHERHADKIVVATTDLCEYGGHDWLPIPVDTDLFSLRKPARNGKAVLFIIRDEQRDIKLQLLKDHGVTLDYTVHDTNIDPILYADMPAFLSKYEYYIDLKWLPIGKILHGLSSTGLQALAVGCKILDHNFEIVKKMPDVCKTEAIVAKLHEYYTG